MEPFVLAALSTVLLLVSAGLGNHESQLSSEKTSLVLKYLYIHSLLYPPAITLPKYSALLFYVRVFGIRQNLGLFRANTLASAGLVTAWFLFAVSYDIFQCTPIRKAWLPQITGHCTNTSNWYLGNAAFSTIVDMCITLLPLPVLWSLHTERKRKMILTGFFFCAYW